MKITDEMIEDHFITCSDCELTYIPMALEYNFYCPVCDKDSENNSIFDDEVIEQEVIEQEAIEFEYEGLWEDYD